MSRPDFFEMLDVDCYHIPEGGNARKESGANL